MSAAMVRMICPNLRCRAILAVPVGLRGKQVRCRCCGSKVNVPGSGGSSKKPARGGEGHEGNGNDNADAA